MPEPSRWFQIHLSTGIVLMFVAGAMMLANWWEWPDGVYFSRGWPIPALNRVNAQKATELGFPLTPPELTPVWTENAVIINIWAALAVLLIVAAGGECIVRRRELRTGDPPHWLGLRLSTWFVLTIAMATLFFMNFWEHPDSCGGETQISAAGFWPTCGWPEMFYQSVHYKNIRYDGWLFKNFGGDVATAALIVLVVGGAWQLQARARIAYPTGPYIRPLTRIALGAVLLVLIWANLHARSDYVLLEYGWPMEFTSYETPTCNGYFLWRVAVLNVLTAVFILLVTFCICESAVRRRGCQP